MSQWRLSYYRHYTLKVAWDWETQTAVFVEISTKDYNTSRDTRKKNIRLVRVDYC